MALCFSCKRAKPSFPAVRRTAPLPGACDAAHSTRERKSGQATVFRPGYRLRISKKGIAITASDAAGAFYGAMTLRQIQRQCGGALPACEIEDHPDFPSRGVMLDISRNKVPTMETLFALVEELAEWKINHLELYTEHTFAYRNHRDVWATASPMTHEEIRRLAAFCRERFIELVPCQQSFGHFARWLERPRYPTCRDPEEKTDTLCPTNPRSLALLRNFTTVAPCFTSRKFDVCCDRSALAQTEARRNANAGVPDRCIRNFAESTSACHELWLHNDLCERHHFPTPRVDSQTAARHHLARLGLRC